MEPVEHVRCVLIMFSEIIYAIPTAQYVRELHADMFHLVWELNVLLPIFSTIVSTNCRQCALGTTPCSIKKSRWLDQRQPSMLRICNAYLEYFRRL